MTLKVYVLWGSLYLLPLRSDYTIIKNAVNKYWVALRPDLAWGLRKAGPPSLPPDPKDSPFALPLFSRGARAAREINPH